MTLEQIQTRLDEFKVAVESGSEKPVSVGGFNITSKYAYRKYWFYVDGESMDFDRIAKFISAENEE